MCDTKKKKRWIKGQPVDVAYSNQTDACNIKLWYQVNVLNIILWVAVRVKKEVVEMAIRGINLLGL